MFKSKNVSLLSEKLYLGFPSVTLLGQYIDSLGYAISKEKVQAIQVLKFPHLLRDLEIYLGLTGQLRSSIERYTQVSKPLQVRKTTLTKNIKGTKGQARKRLSIKMLVKTPTKLELDIYARLQRLFSSPIFLVYYDPKRILYINLDTSKRIGFTAIIYYIKGDLQIVDLSKVPRISVQPIMFLSKLLNTAESKYWPTELEVTGIIQVIKKTRYIIESL